MLKLEKIARTRDLNVTMRDRPVFFNRTLLCALGLAVSIHLGALLIFHIAPFKIGYDESIFPPVLVATDLQQGNPENFVSTLFEVEERIPDWLIPPLPTKPAFPEIPKSALARQMEYIKQKSLLNNPFLQIEEDKRVLDFASPFQEPKDYVTVKIHLSGSLADRIVLRKDTFDEELAELTANSLPAKAPVPHRFIYDVQMESQTGEIFWYEPRQAGEDDDKDIQQFALNILRNLHFQPDRDSFVTVGEIEIVITPPVAYDVKGIDLLF